MFEGKAFAKGVVSYEYVYENDAECSLPLGT